MRIRWFNEYCPSVYPEIGIDIFFVKARWPVKLSVKYDQSQGEHAGSIDEHAGSRVQFSGEHAGSIWSLDQLYLLWVWDAMKLFTVQ